MASKKGSRRSGAEQTPAILTIIPDWADAAAIGMLVGLSDRQIQNLTRSGVLTKETPPGRKVQKYRTCKAVQQYIAHVRQKAGEQEQPKDLVLRKLEAEVRLKESQGQLASIKADIAEGRYIETAAASQQLAEFMDTFKHFALNIPSRVAGTVASYTDTVTAKAIETSTRKELEDMLFLFADAAMLAPGRGTAVTRYRLKPFEVPAWIMPAAAMLRPRKRLPVSQWAEQNRILPDGNAIPGPFRNQVTPYLVEIMDAFSSDQIEKIVFVKPTQVGGTTAMENMLGSAIDQDPGPAMIVYPSDDLAARTVDAKLEPMIRRCKPLAALYQETDSKKLQLKFGTMTVYLNGANSPADLSSTNIRYLFLDEVDKYPGASKKEADPVSLAIERTKSYTINRKIFITSTPTLKTGHIWRAKEAAEAEKHYFVPCPHCGTYIELKFAQIKWPSKDGVPDSTERANRARYVCQVCEGVITDRDKGRILEAGRWQFVRKTTETPRSVAYWMSTLYSPFTRFSDIAKAFMDSKDDPELFQNFVNSWLAEPWEDTKLKTNADIVMERQTEVPAWELPAWTKLLTGGIDVQENCLYWTIRAWGDFMTSQNIAHGQALSMSEVERVMNTSFLLPSGEKLMVELALMDSGDQTDAVYEFCLVNSDWVRACKGVPPMQGYYRISTVNKAGSRANGMQLVLVDGGKYKDMIAARMRRPNGTGSWMVHKDCDLEYAEQVTSEHKITERKNGKVVYRWDVKHSHADNHYLDCEVYAAAAADVMEVRSLFLQNSGQPGQQAEKPAQAAQQAEPTPEEAWIGTHEDWI